MLQKKRGITMAAKTIMKRIAIAALSAVILQGVTPLDSLNVYASENTGASYTALDIYRINVAQSIH